MAVVNPVIFQITGFQNSGKTAFVKRLIHDLSCENLITVTVKHHGHGGKPSIPETKDSAQHIEAGAAVSLVEGDGRLIIHAEKKEWALEEKLRLLLPFQSDIILIEGHKHEDYPKAVLIRRREEAEELLNLKNIKVIFYWDRSLIDREDLPDVPAFHIKNHNGYYWLVQLLLEKTKRV